MIGRLHGILIEKQLPYLLIDVHGVGYEVEVPMSTGYTLPAPHESVTLLIHTLIREDAQLLYGFQSATERLLFRALLKVSGVGAKMALAILSGMSCSEFVTAIRQENTAALMRLPGVGKKSAERLVIEMRDRLKDWAAPAESPLSPTTPHPSTPDLMPPAADAVSEAMSALIGLGYRPAEAQKLISRANTEGMSSEALIRAALKSAVSDR